MSSQPSKFRFLSILLAFAFWGGLSWESADAAAIEKAGPAKMTSCKGCCPTNQCRCCAGKTAEKTPATREQASVEPANFSCTCAKPLPAPLAPTPKRTIAQRISAPVKNGKLSPLFAKAEPKPLREVQPASTACRHSSAALKIALCVLQT
jgi:hypothetical protein